MSVHPLEEILNPQSIAVVGASGSGGRGGGFLTPLLDLGFKGKIYPVNPKYSEIEGLKAYPSLREIPDTVDFVISAVPASQVLKMLDDANEKKVKGIHLFTARFSETGRKDAAELEQEVLRRAKEYKIRLIGPNCMGVYHPRLGISFREGLPTRSGSAGLASQSGNVCGEIVQMSTARGIYFTKAISYGNAIDFNECDYLEYFAQDPETKVIMMYIEGVKDGRRFFNTLRQVTPTKPVVVLKGGRGNAGARATASHTASLAGSVEIWETAISQAGAVSAQTVDELVDIGAAFYFLPPVTGRNVGVAGGAGGASVLAADQCEEAGLNVIPLPTKFREEMKNKGIPIWDWLGNPADMSIRVDDHFPPGDVLAMMARYKEFDLLITIMHAHFHRGQENITVEKYLEQYNLKESTKKPFLAVLENRESGNNDNNNPAAKLMEEAKTRLTDTSIPFYPSIQSAAIAASKMISYYQKKR